MSAIVYPKWFVKSKTFIFNLLAIVFLAGPMVSDFLMDLVNLPELQPHAKIILAAVAVINFVLRFRSFVPITVSSSPAPMTLLPPASAGKPISSGSKPADKL